MPEKLWHLKNCNLFQQLSPEEFEKLEAPSRSRTYPAHTPIYLPDQKLDSIFLVAEGLVKVSNLSSDGKESILAFLEPGEVFGELALVDIKEQFELVEAVERTTVVMIPANILRQLLSSSTDVSLAVTKLVGLRRQRIEQRLRNLMFHSTRERLIHLLLDMVEQFGQESPQGVRLRIKLSHQDLGNLIGATRETVTSLLCQLRAEGVVEYKRCKVIVTNTSRLAKSVQRTVRVPAPHSNPSSETGRSRSVML